MENHSVSSSPWNSNFVEPTTKCKPTWTNMGPIKRKASDDPDMGFGPHECFEPPLKQFAFDNSGAANINNVIKDGYVTNQVLVDHAATIAATTTTAPNCFGNGNDGNNKGLIQTDDVEMEENPNGEIIESSVKDGNIIEKINDDDDDDIEDSCPKFPFLSSNSDIIKKAKDYGQQQFGSIVLSDEVLASMRGAEMMGRPSTKVSTTILPQSIMNQMYKNAMALVVWEPKGGEQLDQISKSYEKNLPPRITTNYEEDDGVDVEEDETIITKPMGNQVSIFDSGGMEI